MKKEINGSAIWYYNLNSKQSITVRYIIVLKDLIDGDMLRKAMDITAKRYPYLLDKVVVTPEGYHLEPCTDLPIVVKNTIEPINLCGKEANYHQIALSYEGWTIFFNNTHSIFDGRGRSAFLHTLLYYYFKLRYPNEEIEMPNVRLADSEIDPAEYYDPFTEPLPEPKIKLPEVQKPTNIMQLSDMGLVYKQALQMHFISIDEKQLMACCKMNDASPNTAIALLMARAIARLHPDSDKTISAGVYCDLRSVLKADKTHQPLVTTLELEYSPSMRELDFSDQNTIFRGKMLLQTEPSHLLKECNNFKKANEMINSQPTLESKLTTAKSIMSTILKGHTFSISYSGKTSYGSCDKYISALFPSVYGEGVGLLLEITAADGMFYITFVQEWKEDVYFNAFLKEMRSLGLDYDLLYSSKDDPAYVDFE